MKCRSRHQGWVVAIALAGAGCADGAEPGAPRAPAEAVPQSIAIGAATVTEGTAMGHARKPREVSGFRIARSPVTVGQYRHCVSARVCTTPAAEGGFCTPGFAPTALDGPTFEAGDDAIPMTCVTTEQAKRFCRWVGGRLPAPAEWQLAARGPEVQRHAWGAAAPTCERHWRVAFGEGPGACCGSECSQASLGRIGARPAGASAAGLWDVLSTRAELVAGDERSPWASCRDRAAGCIVNGSSPGAIEVFLPGSVQHGAALPAGFRCVWEEAQ